MMPDEATSSPNNEGQRRSIKAHQFRQGQEVGSYQQERKRLARAFRFTDNFSSSSRTHAIRRLLRWSTHTKAEPRSRIRIVEDCFFTMWSKRPEKHDKGLPEISGTLNFNFSMAEPAIALRIHLQTSLTSFRNWIWWCDTVNERRLSSLGCRGGCFICCSGSQQTFRGEWSWSIHSNTVIECASNWEDFPDRWIHLHQLKNRIIPVLKHVDYFGYVEWRIWGHPVWLTRNLPEPKKNKSLIISGSNIDRGLQFTFKWSSWRVPDSLRSQSGSSWRIARVGLWSVNFLSPQSSTSADDLAPSVHDTFTAISVKERRSCSAIRLSRNKSSWYVCGVNWTLRRFLNDLIASTSFVGSVFRGGARGEIYPVYKRKRKRATLLSYSRRVSR